MLRKDYLADYTPNKQQARLVDAFTRNNIAVNNLFQKHLLSVQNLRILFIALKEEGILMLYAKNKEEAHFKLIKEYPILTASGCLGPKKSEGDKQVPEGFYIIDRFNPLSKYHLSLGINYPNAYDAVHQHSGSDIFLHGGTETVGCLPFGDEAIEEIYLIADIARFAKQTDIPIYIFPFKMDDTLKRQEATGSLFHFWKNLQEGYLLFHEKHIALHIEVQDKKYIFK